MLKKIVSLTSQNQISIPVEMLKVFGKNRPKKLIVSAFADELRIKPIVDIWSLAGSLKGDIKLSDKQLREARYKFEKEWPREM